MCVEPHAFLLKHCLDVACVVQVRPTELGTDLASGRKYPVGNGRSVLTSAVRAHRHGSRAAQFGRIAVSGPVASRDGLEAGPSSASHIHNLEDRLGDQSSKGKNPFEGFYVGEKKLSSIVKAYDPPRSTSAGVYNYISANLADWIEEAIEIRKRYA